MQTRIITDNELISIAKMAKVAPKYSNIFADGCIRDNIASTIIKSPYLDEFAKIIAKYYLRCEHKITHYHDEYRYHIMSDYGGSKTFANMFIREHVLTPPLTLIGINYWDVVLDCYVRSEYFEDYVDIQPNNMFIHDDDYLTIDYIISKAFMPSQYYLDIAISLLQARTTFYYTEDQVAYDKSINEILEKYWIGKIPVEV